MGEEAWTTHRVRTLADAVAGFNRIAPRHIHRISMAIAIVASIAGALVIGILSPGVAGPSASFPVEFVDVAQSTGLGADRNVSGRDQAYIVETSIGGTAFFDYDDDGDIDLYVVNGSSFHGFPAGERPFNHLYRNRGGLFDDVTAAAGVGDTSWSLGCAAADFDNDGHLDLYVANFRPQHPLQESGQRLFRGRYRTGWSGRRGVRNGGDLRRLRPRRRPRHLRRQLHRVLTGLRVDAAVQLEGLRHSLRAPRHDPPG